MSFIKNIINRIPENIRPFVLRGAILLIAWELLYTFILRPIHIPDDQLTYIVQYGGMEVLKWFYADVQADGNTIILNGVESVDIARQCNGLELIVLYLGFLFCVPSSFKKMLAYGVIGTLVIYTLNIFRTAALAAMFEQSHEMADFAHHYLFKIIIYAVVFLGWVLYLKKPKTNESTN